MSLSFHQSGISVSGAGGEEQSVNLMQNNHTTNNQESLTGGFFPVNLNASGIACWWSIRNLITTNPGRCHFWTLTFKDAVSDAQASNMHRELMRDINHAVRSFEWPAGWGGVKVAEAHPGGHGIHFHWVINGVIPIRTLNRIAAKWGFGRIQVDKQPATPALANYLAKYLTKKSDKLHGIRKWGCIGNYSGVRARDIEFDSPSINVFRGALREAVSAGKPKGAAFLYAMKKQQEFDLAQHENI